MLTDHVMATPESHSIAVTGKRFGSDLIISAVRRCEFQPGCMSHRMLGIAVTDSDRVITALNRYDGVSGIPAMSKLRESPNSGLSIARAQAAVQQAKADTAILGNVRDLCQQAADSWTNLADRIERVGPVAASDVEKH